LERRADGPEPVDRRTAIVSIFPTPAKEALHAAGPRDRVTLARGAEGLPEKARS
jgi:hypothetical protein